MTGRCRTGGQYLAVDAGPDLAAQAELTLAAADGGYRLALAADATLAGLAGGPARPLVSGISALHGTAIIGLDGDVQFDGVALRVAAGEIILAGSADWRRGTLDVTATVKAGSPQVFAQALPGIGWEHVSADIHVNGPLETPRIEVAAEALDVTSAGVAVARFATSLVVDPGLGGDGRIPFEGQGLLEGLSSGDAEVDVLLAPAVTLRVSGNWQPDGTAMIEQFEVANAGTTIAGSGIVDADGAIAADGSLTIADLKMLRPVAKLPVDGRVDASWRVSSSNLGLTLQTDGRLGDLKSGVAAIDALLADTVSLRSSATIGLDGAVDITELQVTSGGNAVAARIRFADQRLATDWSLSVPSLGAVSQSAGIALDGRLEASGRLLGPLSDLLLESDVTGQELVLDGRSLPDLHVRARLDDLTDRPDGTVRLEASVADRPAHLEFGLKALADGGYRFDPVAGEFAGSAVTGAIDMLPDGGFAGQLEGRAQDVASLVRQFDLPLSGSTDLLATLSVSDGRQRLHTTLEMAGTAFGDEAAAATVSVDLTIDDLLGEARLEGRAAARDVRAGDAEFDRVDAQLRGRADALTLSLAVAGTELSGEISGAWVVAGDRRRLDLKSLVGEFRGESFVMARPASISVDPGSVSVDPVEISVGGGRVSVVGVFGETTEASLEVADLSMELISLLIPGHPMVGRLNGAAEVSGPASRLGGSFQFRVSELRFGMAEDAGLPPPDVTATGRWSEGRLALQVAADMPDGSDVRLDADLPLAFSPGASVPVFGPRSTLAASATGSVDVALLDDLLAAAGNRVEGRLTLDLRVSGTVGEPIIAGTVVLSDGRYENAFYGSRLAGISAKVEASGTLLRLTELSATTPAGGTLQGSGSLALSPNEGFPLTVDVSLRNGEVVDTALASATADADLRLEGALIDTLLLSGEVSIIGAELRIPDRLPSSVAELTVEERNLPPEIAARRAAREPSQPAAAVDATLDLVASASRSVFIRGRGVDVELNGDLTIKGSAAAPAIGGSLGLHRGTFDFLGRRLTFRRGGVGFDGSSKLDPEIDLLATVDVDDYAIEVDVGGRVSDPTLTLTSVPELPDEEIVSLLLFGKDVGSLSAFEALSLAESAGQLSGAMGGSSGLIGGVRDTTGLDRLAVETGDSEGGASVTGGRYAAEGVYVGVEQGLDEQSSRVNVEVELTPNVTVESDVGADAQGRIGVRVEWDY